MNMEEIYSIFKFCNYTICTDTRNIIQGSLFIALKGETFNANLFVEEAIKQGCSFAISDEYKGNDTRIIKVGNTLETLQLLAHNHREKSNAKIIGITGTNGKTTTKELMAAVLHQKYSIVYTQGNFNNHIGVPLTLLSIKPETEIVVVEMGANHPGEISTLCKIANPTFGIITNVGKAHLEGFGSFEGVINTKTELYRHIQNNNGTLFVNKENAILFEKAKNNIMFTYGTSDTADIKAQNISANPMLSLSWNAHSKKEPHLLETKLVGYYNWENVLAAIAIGTYFNVSPEKINITIQNYIPTNHRSQWVQKQTNHILMDAYNANPTSMQLALSNFFALPYPNKTVILGDMLELGNYSEEEHINILHLLLQQQKNVTVYLIGPQFSKLSVSMDFKTFLTVNDFIEQLKTKPIKDAAILIKGSHGIHLEKLMENF